LVAKGKEKDLASEYEKRRLGGRKRHLVKKSPMGAHTELKRNQSRGLKEGRGGGSKSDLRAKIKKN